MLESGLRWFIHSFDLPADSFAHDCVCILPPRCPGAFAAAFGSAE